ncbi:Ribosome biogenesis ATPase rix7 [Lecanicillium sp. MT-2017a]|nr:Ribosome biogenesis ATPase rix7 [Lecanicillium sp. MT-2017a]
MARLPNVGLRNGFERDVYQVIKTMEEAGEKPFKSVYAAYDAIKRSNSSLSRQKKKPLEDALDRVLQVRRQEQSGDSSDSEAALDDAEPEPTKPSDERFLLNRQMTKHWNIEPAVVPSPQTQPQQPATKKRRVEAEPDTVVANGKDGAATSEVVTAASTPKEVRASERASEKAEKALQKKAQRPVRYEVDHDVQPPLLGGVNDTYRLLLEQTAYLLRRPQLYDELNCQRASGIVLSGPPGIGKKSLIKTLAADLGVPVISLAPCLEDAERMEKSLTEAVDTALSMAPCIIFIEDLDLHMAKPGGSTHNEQSQKTLWQFKRQMQRIKSQSAPEAPILAMATTARATDVNPSALQLGLFETTIHMKVPDREARQEIWKVLTRDLSLADDVKLSELAKMTHGFVGADIVNLLSIAERVGIKRLMVLDDPASVRLGILTRETRTTTTHSADYPSLFAQPIDLPTPTDFRFVFDDFKTAMQGFVPSLRKEGFTVIPNVTWDQVGALERVRKQLELSIIGPIRDPELYQSFGLQRPAGALLWGPPGCGKTLLAQAVANEAQASFILINGPELLNKYVGESERAVRELFQRARSSTPCILFFDEMDSLVPRRDSSSTDAGVRVVNALLTELDGVQDRSGIYIIGTTNRPDMIDAAMLRPGRLSVRLFVDLPTAEERVDILRTIYRTCHASPSDAELARLPAVALDERCTDFSGADLGGLHTKAAECALSRYLQGEKTERVIDEADWEDALAGTQRSVWNPDMYRKLDAKLRKST